MNFCVCMDVNKVTVTEGDGGLSGGCGGDEKKEEGHDGDASHFDGREKEMSVKCNWQRELWLLLIRRGSYKNDLGGCNILRVCATEASWSIPRGVVTLFLSRDLEPF